MKSEVEARVEIYSLLEIPASSQNFTSGASLVSRFVLGLLLILLFFHVYFCSFGKVSKMKHIKALLFKEYKIQKKLEFIIMQF